MIDRRRLMFTVAAGAGLAASGCAVTPAPGPVAAAATTGAAAAFHALMDRAFEASLDQSPEAVTAFGLHAGARAASKSQLTAPTLAQQAEGEALVRDFVRDLAAIDRSALTGQDAIYYDTLEAYYRVILNSYSLPDYGRGSGTPYHVTQQNGAYQGIPDFLHSQHTIDTAADADAYVARIRALAVVLNTETDRLVRDFARGVVPPDFILDNTIGQQKGIVATPAAQSPMVASVVSRTAAKGLTGDWGAQVERLLTQAVYPALVRQTRTLEAARATASHDAGIWRLPSGAAIYAQSLRFWTMTDLGPDEIHDIGVRQVAELTARADGLLRAQGLTEGSVGARINAMGRDPRYLYPNTDAGKAQLLQDLNGQMQAMERRLPQYFGRLPESSVEIRRVPTDIEAGASLGYYNRPSLDGSRPGIYYINLRNTAEWPRFSLPTLTYHEAAPGHHFQIALQQENAATPLLMNTVYFGSYTEGWGLYAEQLADEMGVYADDPIGQIGYLQSMIFRSARLVVDTGLHHKRWSREQAIAYMVETTGDQESSSTSEVDRYCASPGQACSYKVGHNEWVRLREKARSQLGDRFDIRGFHDAGLAGGGVPFAVLERIIDNWIASRRA